MAQNYIVTHYKRDKNKSKIPSSFGQRSHYALSRSLYSQKLQEKHYQYEGKDKPAYGYPECLTGAAWDEYTKNPFDFTTRKDFLSTISLPCIDKMKDTKMTPPLIIPSSTHGMDRSRSEYLSILLSTYYCNTPHNLLCMNIMDWTHHAI